MNRTIESEKDIIKCLLNFLSVILLLSMLVVNFEFFFDHTENSHSIGRRINYILAANESLALLILWESNSITNNAQIALY
jgi:hypothetical protein